jgi:hypothetical protein
MDKRPDEREIDYLVRLAARNICEGVIEEPRVYYDSIRLNQGGLATQGSPDVFINGEQFPVRLLCMALAVRPDFAQALGLDERDIQRMGFRVTFHDQFYQSRDFVAAPLWSNKVVAGPAPTTTGISQWTFPRPVILSARDSLRVEVALESVPATPRRVTISFTGTGLISKRPYFFSEARLLTDTTKQVLDPRGFRNDGAEPVALTDVTFHCGAEEAGNDSAGDIRQLRVQIRQVGNGTGADWFIGPTVPLPLTQCPALLLGPTEGRAIIHHFPGDGLMWEPGEGVTVEGLALDPSVENEILGVSMLGYLALT